MKMEEHLENAHLFESQKARVTLLRVIFEPDPRLRPARLAEYDKIAKSETELAMAYRRLFGSRGFFSTSLNRRRSQLSRTWNTGSNRS